MVEPGKSLDLFHPLIKRWFEERVGAPTDVQDLAWPIIARGEHVLVTAPTGSGKTLTAFLWASNQLVTGHLGDLGVNGAKIRGIEGANTVLPTKQGSRRNDRTACNS